MKNFYITTPIYYVNGDPHIGTSYTTIAADVMARYRKSMGDDVYFLTGTDEHGQKVQEAAEKNGYTPQAWTDAMESRFRDMWKLLKIDYTDYIRTTQERHKKSVKKILQAVYDKGDIYKGEYEGKYCVSCETFFPENQLNGKDVCPDCGKHLSLVKEESYFFKMSKYQDELLKHIDEHPDFILPRSRRNEVISFIKQGLQDLSISRNTFTWGIPMDFAPGHITYVWFDALTNYITAVGYENDAEKFEKYWNNSRVAHLIGKDIIRFHAIIWPCMLLSAGVKLPDSIVAHGWWTSEGEKMSKSRNNVVDPVAEINKYGVDALRYFLMREANFASDGDYSRNAIENRINSDLANDLGNLLNRTLGMYKKYFDATIQKSGDFSNLDKEIISLFDETIISAEEFMYMFEYSKALEIIWKFISRMNKYIDETTPWILCKDENKKQELATVMNILVESLYKIAFMIYPFMPDSAQKMINQLGFDINVEDLKIDNIKSWNIFKENHKLGEAKPIFPRIEKEVTKKEIKQEIKKEKKENKNESKKEKKEIKKSEIEIDTFSKVDISVVEILEVEKVEGADKLLKFKVFDGENERQIISGIAKYYKNLDELQGKKILAVVNLKPVKLRGILSQGMLLTTEDKGNVELIFVNNNITAGSKIS